MIKCFKISQLDTDQKLLSHELQSKFNFMFATNARQAYQDFTLVAFLKLSSFKVMLAANLEKFVET